MPEGPQSMTDDRMWLRFDNRSFAVGDNITPCGYRPPQRRQAHKPRQFRQDRVYIVRAAGPDRVAPAAWNDLDRWCYQVDPAQPLERDGDPTHFDIFDSWTCRSATVRRILRKPPGR
jgi:hypothetical protein